MNSIFAILFHYILLYYPIIADIVKLMIKEIKISFFQIRIVISIRIENHNTLYESFYVPLIFI